MNPIVRVIGRVLRLVGISSPEDNVRRPEVTAGVPSWREKASIEATKAPKPEKGELD